MQNNNLIWVPALVMTLLAGLAAVRAWRHSRANRQEALYRSTSALQQTMEITQSGTWSVDYLKARESMLL